MAAAALVTVAGALISGFTILRGIDPFDEGLMLQAARRTASGEWPYRDFLWSYGPGQVVLLAGSFKGFGTSLLWWRIVRTAVDALVGLAVFLIVRRAAGTRWALAGWLTAVCAMAEPTSANPFPLALLLGLLAVGVAATWSRPDRAAAAAGALTALTALWRPDFAAYALLASATGILLRRDAGRRALAIYAGALAAVTLVTWLPFAIAAGPGEVLDSVVARSLRDGSYWRLPFPLHYRGSVAGGRALKHALEFYLPLIAAIGLALVVADTALRRRGSPLLGGLAVLGCGTGLYLIARTDAFHVTPLVVVLAAAIPLAAAPAPRALAIPAVCVLALLAVHGVANRAAAVVSPPALASLHLPVADGVRAPPQDARALPRIVGLVQRRVPPGAPIYVAPLRSDLVRINDPLLYVLCERPNVLREDFGLETSAAAQARIVASLSRSRPRAVVRWLDPVSAEREPNRRGTPSGSRILDAWLAREYRLLERDGPYAVLVPR